MVELDNDATASAPNQRKCKLAYLISFLPRIRLSRKFHLSILFIISMIPSEASSKVDEITTITVFEEEIDEGQPIVGENIELGGAFNTSANISKGNNFPSNAARYATIELALQWLAHHQEPDGSWDATKYGGKSKDMGSTTAVALLAFLGAGHNEYAGKYRKNIKAGIKYLNQCMEDPKMLERPSFLNNYGNALVLMALSEDTIFGASPTTKKNANRMAELLIAQYINDPVKKGWGTEGAGDDVSVSGWVGLGLKSAKAADLPAMQTPDAKIVFEKFKIWVDQVMTIPETDMGLYGVAGVEHAGIDSQHMTWVGMYTKQFLGFPLSDPFLKKASEVSITAVNSKIWIGGEKPGPVFGIYFGMLAAFHQQGVLWEAWWPAIKKTLIGSQKLGDPKELGGSWDPTLDSVGMNGGRVMTTALFALCLEVYYHYDSYGD